LLAVVLLPVTDQLVWAFAVRPATAKNRAILNCKRVVLIKVVFIE
jgi:hypothetical protein